MLVSNHIDLSQSSSHANVGSQGDVENAVHDFAARSNGEVQVQVSKPGLISSDDNSWAVRKIVLNWTIGLPYLHVKELAAAEVDQAVNGFKQDVLENDEAAALGKEALKQYASS